MMEKVLNLKIRTSGNCRKKKLKKRKRNKKKREKGNKRRRSTMRINLTSNLKLPLISQKLSK